MKKTFSLFALSLLVCFATFAQVSMTSNTQIGTIGKMKVEKFNKLNAKGTAMVTAITPTAAALSTSDNSLLMQVAMGGQKQLAISQAALSKVTDPQAKLLAQAEVEEQTTIAAKLREIAAAKGVTLPATTDATTQTSLSQINSLSGAALDAFYVAESGIKGHQELETTMTTVKKTAEDPALKALAKATLPVILVHLKTSQEVQASMNATGSSASR